MQCKRIYCPRSHELESAENCGYCSGNGFVLTLFGREFSPANLFINFFLKRFGKEYAQHAEIVKELAQRNDEIYRTVMVSIIQIITLGTLSLASRFITSFDYKSTFEPSQFVSW